MNHAYVSTYCVHELHANCRTTCKTCQAPCLCPCHREAQHGRGDELAQLAVERLLRAERAEARVAELEGQLIRLAGWGK